MMGWKISPFPMARLLVHAAFTIYRHIFVIIGVSGALCLELSFPLL